MELKDEARTCRYCTNLYIWSAGEQQYYRERVLDPPVRCPDCRAKKRQAIREETESLKEGNGERNARELPQNRNKVI